VVRSAMPLRSLLRLAAALIWLAGCGPVAPPAPTPTTAPVAARTPTTGPAAAATPTIAPAGASKPTVAPTPPAAGPTPTAPSAASSRVEALNAANAAFRSGDLERAAGLYDRVLNTPPTGESPAARSAIDDVADFRAMVALLANGREDDGRAHLDALQKRDANAPLARLGNQLWDQYGMTGQLRGACAQLQPQVQSQVGPQLATLQGLGVTIEANTLCSVPQG
jgi:hypothetical protein